MTGFLSATDHQVMVDELKQRGVEFPIGGFAPGRYSVVCGTCRRRFDGDKRSYQCLPCALAKAIGADRDVAAARREGERDGYRQAVADLMEGGRRRHGGDRVVIETEVGTSTGLPAGRA